MDKVEHLREELGKAVRAVWVKCAEERSDSKPHHLLPWEELDEWNKEVDRRIGTALYLLGAEDGERLRKRREDDYETAEFMFHHLAQKERLRKEANDGH